MKSILKPIIAIATAIVLTACGDRVEVGPAEVGKIMTKDGYQEGIIGTSKFRLPACWTYCDKLIALDVSDQTKISNMQIFMPEDKLNLSVGLQMTLSIDSTKVDSLFGTIPPTEVNDRTVIQFDRIYSTYAENVIAAKTREYLTEFSIAEVASSRRKINSDLRAILMKEFKGSTPFLVRNIGLKITYPRIITDAQENAAKRREQIQQEEAQLEISKVQLERQLQEAQLQRQIDFEKAKGEAAAQKIQRAVVDKRVLDLRKLENERMWIEKWDGKLPVTAMGDAIPMIQLGK